MCLAVLRRLQINRMCIEGGAGSPDGNCELSVTLLLITVLFPCKHREHVTQVSSGFRWTALLIHNESLTSVHLPPTTAVVKRRTGHNQTSLFHCIWSPALKHALASVRRLKGRLAAQITVTEHLSAGASCSRALLVSHIELTSPHQDLTDDHGLVRDFLNEAFLLRLSYVEVERAAGTDPGQSEDDSGDREHHGASFTSRTAAEQRAPVLQPADVIAHCGRRKGISWGSARRLPWARPDRHMNAL